MKPANKILSEKIQEIAKKEWGNPSSISSKNHASVPLDARQGFVVFADIGGVCILEPSGDFRAFSHDRGKEIAIRDAVRRVAYKTLEEHHPAIAALMSASDTHNV